MKYVTLAIGVGLLVASPALGLTYLGTPTTVLKTGEWAVGASYADGRQDVELEGSIDLEHVKEKSTLGHVAVGLADERMELFGLFGAFDLERDKVESNGRFLVGFGTRITMYEGGDLDWGAVGQFTWFTSEDTMFVGGVATDVELNVFDIQVGLGPCWRPGPFILYGGPMIQWITGDVDTDAFGDFDVKAESNFGGYIGGGVELAKHLSVTGEVQGTPDASAWAVSVQWRF